MIISSVGRQTLRMAKYCWNYNNPTLEGGCAVTTPPPLSYSCYPHPWILISKFCFECSVFLSFISFLGACSQSFPIGLMYFAYLDQDKFLHYSLLRNTHWKIPIFDLATSKVAIRLPMLRTSFKD